MPILPKITNPASSRKEGNIRPNKLRRLALISVILLSCSTAIAGCAGIQADNSPREPIGSEHGR